MAAVQTLTGKVFKVTDKNNTGFVFGPEDGNWADWPMKAEFYDGKESDGRWFNVGKNRETGRLNCARPPEGGIVTLAFEISPPKGEYGESFWVKNWHENGTQQVAEERLGAYETAQQEAADRVSESPEPKKDYPDHQAITRESIERQVALKAAVEMWKGAETIPDAKVIADYARNLYAGLFNHALGHTHDDGTKTEPDWPDNPRTDERPLNDDDPGPQPD